MRFFDRTEEIASLRDRATGKFKDYTVLQKCLSMSDM